MKFSGEDRRKYARSKRCKPVVVDDGGPGVLNHVDNISGNGVLCHTVKPLPLMTKLRMALEIPPHNGRESRRVECEGIVVRCDPHDLGDDHFKVAILFTDISSEDREAIEHSVDADLAEPSELLDDD